MAPLKVSAQLLLLVFNKINSVTLSVGLSGTSPIVAEVENIRVAGIKELYYWRIRRGKERRSAGIAVKSTLRHDY